MFNCRTVVRDTTRRRCYFWATLVKPVVVNRFRLAGRTAQTDGRVRRKHADCNAAFRNSERTEWRKQCEDIIWLSTESSSRAVCVRGNVDKRRVRRHNRRSRRSAGRNRRSTIEFFRQTVNHGADTFADASAARYRRGHRRENRLSAAGGNGGGPCRPSKQGTCIRWLFNDNFPRTTR